MLAKSLYQFKDYRKYIAYRLDNYQDGKHGTRARFADTIGCQRPFISQVLNGRQNLTQEQAFRANAFFEHGPDETQFFMLLLQKERAGSTELKQFYLEQLQAISDRKNNVQEVVKPMVQLSEDVSRKFFSSWMYQAVMTALHVRNYTSIEALADLLRMKPDLVEQVCRELAEMGLAEIHSGHYRQVKHPNIRLAIDNPAQRQLMHLSWRAKIAEQITSQTSFDDHHCFCISLDAGEKENFRNKIFAILADMANLRDEDAKTDRVSVLAIDFFDL